MNQSNSNDDSKVEKVNLSLLQPYKQAVILEYDDEERPEALKALREFMTDCARVRRGNAIVVGFGWDGLPDASYDLDIEDVEVTVLLINTSPSWAAADSLYTDTRYRLNLAVFRKGLVAVHLSEPWKSAIQHWLSRKTNRPPLRRVPSRVLQYAFLRGPLRGVWLHGTQKRNALRADSKTLTGPDLNQAPESGDNSFAVNAARAESSAPHFPAKSTIGATPRRSMVWNTRASDFEDFLQFCYGLMEGVAGVDLDAIADASMFSRFAEEVDDFKNVNGAFDVLIDNPSVLALEADDDADPVEASITNALMEVNGLEHSANFTMNVRFPGFDRDIEAHVGVRHDSDIGVDLDCATLTDNNRPESKLLREWFGDPSRPTIYYRSGHVITNGKLFKHAVKPATFGSWRWPDLSDWDISSEKPDGVVGQDLHDAIGATPDRSLFSWVSKTFSSGFLTCDDGANEVADFISISPELDLLELIHVKKSSTDAPDRAISAKPFEVVASQAAKNFYYLNPGTLHERLSASASPYRATWISHERASTRAPFLEALKNLSPTAEKRVVVVQPQVTLHKYRAVKEAPQNSVDHLRLDLIEMLLNGLRMAAIDESADLQVYGDGTPGAASG